MKTFRELDVYPRILLIVMLVMLLVFSVAYPLTISRVGFQYRGAILVPQVQEDQTTYSGTVDGQKTVFTVASDGTITCQAGDKTFGPYILREDPDAVPSNMRTQARGVALYKGVVLHQAVHHRSLRHGDGIALRILVEAIAVKNHQYCRFLTHCSSPPLR